MSFRKFKPNDVVLNTMKAYPSCEFLIYDGNVYYNNRSLQSGSFTGSVPVKLGHISLYEYNTDRKITSTGRYIPPIGTSSLVDKGIIYPFITKDSARSSFKTVNTTGYANEFQYGDILTSSYPMTASISREYMVTAGTRSVGINSDTGDTFYTAPTYPHYYALRNRLNFYGARSEHYKVSSSYGDKDTQTINLISIPSIFWGSKMKPGSFSLKWFLTGSLIGELRDEKQNGELVQVLPKGSTGSGSVAGVALYDEGFILLTGSWALNPETIGLRTSGGADTPKWIYFGAGALDGVKQSTTATSYVSASFNLSFKGTTETQVMTMFAHAKRGEANYSNNPTFLQYNQTAIRKTSSFVYEENYDRVIKNTVSSSYLDYSSSFKRQVYISRVAIYDERKNLIGIATLSNPILKEEDRDLTFKMRLDI
tara:strand:- start:1096 stop:2367 length:1272 start_codon:yes stop_codon:yes gene_type:complete